MNAETFLDNFGHVANAPDGVQSLRQLIMASALAGNVSSPNDDLPEDILVQIENARSTYLAKTGRREKPLLFGPPLIIEFPIPRGWRWIRVGQVCDLQTGATPSRQRRDYFGGNIRWLVSGDINQGEVFDCEGRITKDGLENSNCKVLPNNSVLIALNGQGKTRATVALLRVPAACNQSLVAMIPFNSKIITPEFLFLALRYRYFEIRDITGQDQRRGLNMGLVSELSVPLAPLGEQQRIVAKVNDLMALCDRLETQQQERQKLFPILSQANHERFTGTPNSANLSHIFDETRAVSPADLRKTVHLLAIQGLLVRQIEGGGNGIDVLEKVSLHEIAETDQIPGLPLPRPWAITSFSNVAHIRSGVTKGRNLAGRKTKLVPYLRVANVQRGHLDLTVMKTIEIPVEELEKFQLEPNDLLITEGGDWDKVGRTAVWRGKIVDCIHQNHVFRARLVSEDLNPEWFMLFLNSPVGRRYFESASKQTTNLASINATQLRRCPVPIPPPAEQRRIVSKVDQLTALIDTLEKQQQERNHLAKTFAKAVVASITGTQVAERKEKMKAPKTELISSLSLGTKPKAKDDAPLATLLIKAKGQLPAKSLWQQSGLTIDAFYQQLKTELAHGWIAPPQVAEMKILEEN